MLGLLNNKMNIVNIICILLLVALIVVLIVCLVKNNENFGEHHNNDEEILTCTRQGCSFAKRAEDLIKKNGMKIMDKNVKFVNIESPECAGVNGTPTFIYKGNKVAGYHEDLNELHDKLTKSNESNSGNNNNGSNIKVYGNTRCPYCNKTIELLNKLGISYDFLETDKPEHAEAFKNLNGNGVPLIIITDNNGNQIKRIEGFNINEINKLKN